MPPGTLQDYCRDNPDEKPCAANDPAWLQQLARQREELGALLGAIREKFGTAGAVGTRRRD